MNAHAGIQLLPLALNPPNPPPLSAMNRDIIIRCHINWTTVFCHSHRFPQTAKQDCRHHAFYSDQPRGHLSSEACFCFVPVRETDPWNLKLVFEHICAFWRCTKVQNSPCRWLTSDCLTSLCSSVSTARLLWSTLLSNSKDFSVLEAHLFPLTSVKEGLFGRFTPLELVPGCSLTELIALNQSAWYLCR